ncbi:MAG: alanine:cation symporter family protein [Thermoanaerobaculia bacterium]
MADVSNGLMAAPNLVAILFLARAATRDDNDYFRRLDEATPPGIEP